MGAEIIERRIKTKKKQLAATSVQISLNDWGHLAIRFFDVETPSKDNDALIVFDANTTERIRRFLKKFENDC